VVAGQQFGYGFDTIGNRTMSLAGGDQNGANRRQAGYTANNLNEYTSRTVPGAADVIGMATNTATVWVNQTAAYRSNNYFWLGLPVNNASGPVYQTVTTLAALTNGNATNAEYGVTNIGHVFVPRTPENFGYDWDGNLTNDGHWSYYWDGENRLVAMTNNAGIVAAGEYTLAFAYDYQGRRIQKLVCTNSGLAYVPEYTNRFLYDGWNLVAILNPNASIAAAMMWGTDLSGSAQGAGGVGGLLAENLAANGVHFVAYDGNGNVTALVSASSGTVTANYEYGPFGELIRATGPMAFANPFLFQTEFYDWETGKYYVKHRYYDPSTGRFLNRDPMQEKGGRNLYCFVFNNPINQFDPYGLFEWGAYWSGFAGSIQAQWASMGDALFNGLGGNSAYGAYYGVTLYAPEGMYGDSALGQAEAVGGFTQTATDGCVGTAVICTLAVSYLGTAEFASAYGVGDLDLGIHASFRAGQRNISDWAIRGAIRWGERGFNSGGDMSFLTRLLTTAKYTIPVAASEGGRYLHGLPPEVKDYMLTVVRNIWTSQIITTFIQDP
jgi:RHS repeat-associated protein